MKFGANVWMWVSPFTVDRIDLVDHVADLGYDWIEIGIEAIDQTDWDKVGAAIRNRGLGVSVCAAMGPDRDLTLDDPSINKSGIDYIGHCVDVVKRLGGDLIVGPMYASVGRTWQSTADQRKVELDRSSKNLQEAAKRAADQGVTLALEALNRFETSFINTTEQMLELHRMIDRPNVKIMADTFHMNIEEKKPAEAIEAIGDLLVHMHSNENDRGTPGTGHVDWEGVAKAVKKIGFNGPLVIESFSTEVKSIAKAAAIWRPPAPSSDELAREGLAFLKKLMA